MIGETWRFEIRSAAKKELAEMLARAGERLDGEALSVIVGAALSHYAVVEARHREELNANVIEVWKATSDMRWRLKQSGFTRETLRGIQHGYTWRSHGLTATTRNAGSGRVVWRITLHPIGGAS